MRSSPVAAGDNGVISQYNNLRLDAQAASYLLAHEQASPNMTLYVEPGTVSVDGTLVYFAGGNTGTFTAPVSNNRIDVVTIDSAGTIAITQGTPGASPTAPAVPANKCPIAYVYVRSTSTTLRDTDGGSATGYIYHDLRPFLLYLEKATGTIVDTGTDDTQFLTAKAVNDSHNIPMVAPGASGHVMVSDGTDWTSAAPSAAGLTATTGSSSHSASATGAETIAHGLGTTPTLVELHAVWYSSASNESQSHGSYDGTNNACVFMMDGSGAGNNTSKALYMGWTGGNNFSCTVTVDGTNITLTWGKGGSPSGTAYILWRALK